MKKMFIILSFIFYLTAGCNMQKREEELQKREVALNQREQELLLREKTLEVKENDLANREQLIDSTRKDSAHLVNPALVGQWNVQMTCTETTCPGSAVGDTKIEQWDIAYEANTLVAKAKANNSIVRVYTGAYTGNAVELVEGRLTADTLANTKMSVRLQLTDDTHMEGQREIIRENDCRIVYALKMDKR